MTRRDIVIADDQELLALAAVERVVALANAAVEDRGTCAIALAGGSTPQRLYELLARPEAEPCLPWESLDLFLGDERCVPPDHPDSNYRMVCESLLAGRPGRLPKLRRMRGEMEDREAAAALYEAMLPERLDLLLLGIGADCHTASLFPGSPALQERERRVVPAEAPSPPRERLTITPPVIEAARSVVILASGETKASAVARILGGPYTPRELPAQLALGGTWLLDRAAASQLPEVRP